jgi:SAM-dependent methyltransferase
MVPPLTENDTSVDGVIAIHVMEHMVDLSMARKTLSEVNRVLSENGVFIVLCPDYLDGGSHFFDVDYSHSYITTPHRVYQLLNDGGFTVVRHQYRYGALPFFPGFFLNASIKALFFFLNPLLENFTYRLSGFAKLRYMFARAFMFVARKRPVSCQQTATERPR